MLPRKLKLKYKYGIYKIINKCTGEVYIGASSNLNQRLRVHFSELRYKKHCNKQLQSSFNNYGLILFDYEIIEYMNFPINYDKNTIQDHLYNLEFFHIKTYLEKGIKLYNSATDICGASAGHKVSEEYKQRLRDEFKINNRLAQYQPMASNARIGTSHTLETKIKISKARRKSTKLRFINMFDKQGNYLKTFSFISEAAEYLGIGPSGIKNNLYGLSNSCNNKIFKYTD